MIPTHRRPPAPAGLWAPVAFALAAACALAGSPAPAFAADPYDPARLQATVRTLADTAWTGRGPGTSGLDRAAEYLAERFEKAGLAPLGDRGTYFQEFDIHTGVKLAGENRLATRRGGPWRIEHDFIPLAFSATGVVKRPIVFAGYGITAPEFGYDDYAGVNAESTIVVVLRSEPGEDDSTSRFDGRLPTAHSDLRTKAINAREHGAVGMLVVTGPRYRSGDDELPRLRADGGGISSGLVAASVTRAVADTILARHGVTIAKLQEAIDASGHAHSIAYPDSVEIATGLTRTVARAKNVVGVRRGKSSDRALVVGAHYDHLGLGGESSLAEKSYGLVHPGADDNASGTAALVALAEDETRPAHDRVFAAFAGEEIGARRLGAVRRASARAAREGLGDDQHGHGRTAAGLETDGDGRRHGRRVSRAGARRERGAAGTRPLRLEARRGRLRSERPVLVLQAERAGADVLHRRACRLPQADRHLGQDRHGGPRARRAFGRRGRVARRRAQGDLPAREGRQHMGRIAGGGGTAPTWERSPTTCRPKAACCCPACATAARPSRPACRAATRSWHSTAVGSTTSTTTRTRCARGSPGEQVRVTVSAAGESRRSP